jgi:predicted ATPase
VALDGLPLALELAAVRLRELSPARTGAATSVALRGHAQLSSTWLQQTRRNVAERHRTLQAAIGWSAQLLDPARQRRRFTRWERLAGGGAVDAAAPGVAGVDAAALARLARANLVRLDDGRVHLLETLRAFAREHW